MQSPGFDPQHHISQAYWCVYGCDPELKGFKDQKFKIVPSLSYVRSCYEKTDRQTETDAGGWERMPLIREAEADRSL